MRWWRWLRYTLYAAGPLPADLQASVQQAMSQAIDQALDRSALIAMPRFSAPA